jgi:hypothetical protein
MAQAAAAAGRAGVVFWRININVAGQMPGQWLAHGFLAPAISLPITTMVSLYGVLRAGSVGEAGRARPARGAGGEQQISPPEAL